MATRKRSSNLKQPMASEYEEQKVLVQWLNLKGIVFYHIPNGGYRTIREAAKFKRMGVMPGVPDICIPIPIHPYHGLYLELKRHAGGSLSENQEKWLTKLRGFGYAAHVANGCAHAIQIIEIYFNK